MQQMCVVTLGCVGVERDAVDSMHATIKVVECCGFRPVWLSTPLEARTAQSAWFERVKARIGMGAQSERKRVGVEILILQFKFFYNALFLPMQNMSSEPARSTQTLAGKCGTRSTVENL